MNPPDMENNNTLSHSTPPRMERGNKPGKSSKNTRKINNSIYMDLKEILREYALRYLPAKALHRSRAVCRDWKLQISSPFFIHNQSISFRSISGLFFHSPGSPPSFFSIDQLAYGVPDPELKFLPEPVIVRASSNGLLCCQGQSEDKAYYICNPVNQQWKKLPKPTANHGSNAAIVVAFEPSLLTFVAEYKVVCIYPSTDIEQAYEFEIYSSEKDSWRVPGEMFFSNTTLVFYTGLYMNGVAYWPTNRGKIICFDMKKERAVEIYGGYYGYSSRPGPRMPSLGMMNGRPCLTYMQGLSITVNVLQSVYASTMPLNSNTRAFETKHKVLVKAPDINTDVSPHSHVLVTCDNVIVFQMKSKVFSYDLYTDKTTFVCDQGELSSTPAVFPYVNSLISLV